MKNPLTLYLDEDLVKVLKEKYGFGKMSKVVEEALRLYLHTQTTLDNPLEQIELIKNEVIALRNSNKLTKLEAFRLWKQLKQIKNVPDEARDEYNSLLEQLHKHFSTNLKIVSSSSSEPEVAISESDDEQ
jgi:hypothetical protein